MDRMNPLDCSFLYIEDGTTHMSIASCAVFAGPPPPFADVVALYAAKLHLLPRYRQRVRSVPFGLGRPVWVDDPTFDLAYHLRRVALPSPGGTSELERLMADLMEVELDRTRPLWEAYVVDGLADDRWAVISKVHHCMVDGVAGVDLLSVLLDAVPEAVAPETDEWHPAPAPSSLRLVLDAAGDAGRGVVDAAHALYDAIRSPQPLLARARVVAAGARAYGSATRATPQTSLNGRIGPHRRWTCGRASLEDIRTIRHTFGGTVNDVVLAAITSGFRDLALARGEDPSKISLRTLVPVSMRVESARGAVDNRVSAIFFELPLRVGDPLERLAAVRTEMTRLKDAHEAEAGEALTAFLGSLPPPVTATALWIGARVLNRVQQRAMNTVATNVPGPQQPLYALGREMVEYLPFVPLGPSVRIGVAIVSYNGHVAFGVTGDYAAAPDIDVVAHGIEAEIARLLRLAAPSDLADDVLVLADLAEHPAPARPMPAAAAWMVAAG